MKIFSDLKIDYLLDVEGDDNVFFHRVEFVGNGRVRLRDNYNVEFDRCTFHDGLYTSAAIEFRSTGQSLRLLVQNSKFWNLKGDGVRGEAPNDTNLPPSNFKLQISRNAFWNIGTTGLHHAVYNMVQDAEILYNSISHCSGNGLSLRTSGHVKGNKINDCLKSCIRYNPDHVSGPTDLLLIEDNYCTGIGTFDHPLISLWYDIVNPTPLTNLVNRYEILRNDMRAKGNGDTFRVQRQEFGPKRVIVKDNFSFGKLQLAYVDDYAGNIELPGMAL
jgi:hypothetical protein